MQGLGERGKGAGGMEMEAGKRHQSSKAEIWRERGDFDLTFISDKGKNVRIFLIYTLQKKRLKFF